MKILDPSERNVKPQSGDSLSTFIGQAVLTGLSAGLASGLKGLTGDEGPWLLYADGSVEAWPETPHETPTAPEGMVTCACGQHLLIDGGAVEIGGMYHRANLPCFHVEPGQPPVAPEDRFKVPGSEGQV